MTTRPVRKPIKAAAAPNWPLTAACFFLAAYLLLFYAWPIASLSNAYEGKTAFDIISQRATGRWQFWALLLLPEEMLRAWSVNASWLAIGQRLFVAGVAALIFGVACALGWLCLQASRLGDTLTRLETFAFSAGVGLNLTSLVTLALGLGGALQPEVFATIAAAIVAAAVYAAFQRRQQTQAMGSKPPEKLSAPTFAALVACVPFLAIYLGASMLPPGDFDVREYHLQAPKEFFQHGRIDFLPHNVYANMPLGAEMVALVGMIATGDWWIGALVGKTLIACFAPLTSVLLFCAGRRLQSPLAGAIAGLVYLSIPWVAIVSTQGLIEGALSFYLFAALYAVLLWQEHASEPTAARLLALAGFMAGAAAACKYPGMVYSVLPLGGWIGYQAVFKNRDLHGLRLSWPSRLKPLMIYALFVVAGCGLWYAKNAVLTGNPTYPLLYSVFDGQTRTPAKELQWLRAHSPPNYSPADLAERLWNIALASDWQSPVVIPLAALAVVFLRRKPGVVVLAGYVSLIVVTWWLLTHRIERFWLPILPMVALMAGLGAVWSDNKVWRRLVYAALALGCTYSFAILSSSFAIDNRYLADYRALQTDTDTLRMNPAHLYLNLHKDDITGVLLVGDAQPFDLEVPALYNTTFDDSIFENIVRDHTPEEIRAAFNRLGISDVYVAWNEIERYRTPGNYGFTDFIEYSVFNNLLRDGVLQPHPDRHNGMLAGMRSQGGALYRVLPATKSLTQP